MDKHIDLPSTESGEVAAGANSDRERSSIPLEQIPKGRWERSWPTIACGAGLFSDGYVQSVSPRNRIILLAYFGPDNHRLLAR